MLNISFFWLYTMLSVVIPGFSVSSGIHTRTEEVWIFDHYEPVKDKIIGIWPRHQRYETSAEIQKLKNKFGFNYVLLPSSLYRNTFTLLVNNGFPRENIMAQILPDNFRRKIDAYGKIYAYYLDEPNERGFSTDGIAEAINSSGALFIISGYRRTSGLTSLAQESDGIMFSSYKHWWQCFPGVWCAWPEDPDQRGDWSDMIERYGKKSFMNWVGAHRDTSEYSDLLKYSSDLKLHGVWLYQYHEMTNSEENILRFCHYAWVNGYLKKFERKFFLEYRCDKQDVNDCGSKGWYLYKKWAAEEVRESVYK